MVKEKATDPSGCCRKFFMAFTCWKWQDISVASTISTTRALSSLDENKKERGGKKGEENMSHVLYNELSNSRVIKADLFRKSLK